MSLRAGTFLRKRQEMRVGTVGPPGPPWHLGTAGRWWLNKQLPVSFRILSSRGSGPAKGCMKSRHRIYHRLGPNFGGVVAFNTLYFPMPSKHCFLTVKRQRENSRSQGGLGAHIWIDTCRATHCPTVGGSYRAVNHLGIKIRGGGMHRGPWGWGLPGWSCYMGGVRGSSSLSLRAESRSPSPRLHSTARPPAHT